MLNLFLANLWRWKCGLPEITMELKPDYNSLKTSEWSDEFERYMRNRLVIGALRYGLMNAENKPKYDIVKSIISRINKYQETGNKEFLVDIANLCMIEFVENNHNTAHFCAIDDGEHVKV